MNKYVYEAVSDELVHMTELSKKILRKCLILTDDAFTYDMKPIGDVMIELEELEIAILSLTLQLNKTTKLHSKQIL